MAVPNVFDNTVRPRGVNGMTTFTCVELPVAASQTIKANDVLALSSSKVQQAIAAPAASNATVSGGNLPLVGVALYPITTDASGNETAGGITRTTTVVALFDDELNVLFRFAGGITATAAVTAAALAFGGTIGLASEVQDVVLGTTKYNLGRYTNAAGASWYFLSGGTTNGEFIVVEITHDFWQSPTVEFPTVWTKAVLSTTVRQDQ